MASRNRARIGALLTLSAIFTPLFSTPAQARLKLSLVGGLSSSSVAAAGASEPTYGSGTSFSEGLLVEVPLRNSRFDFETGVLHAQRKFVMNYPSQNLSFAATASLIEVPLLLRSEFGPRFSLAAGPYLAEGVGGFAETSSAGVSDTLSYADAGVNRLDYGFMGSVRYFVARKSNFGFFADGRYFSSLGNMTSSASAKAAGDSFKYSGFEIFLGIRFGAGQN